MCNRSGPRDSRLCGADFFSLRRASARHSSRPFVRQLRPDSVPKSPSPSVGTDDPFSLPAVTLVSNRVAVGAFNPTVARFPTLPLPDLLRLSPRVLLGVLGDLGEKCLVE